MCQCTEYKLLELQVRLSEENTYTQCYDTAVPNCKNIRQREQGSKTHSSIRQSNLQRKNETATQYTLPKCILPLWPCHVYAYKQQT